VYHDGVAEANDEGDNRNNGQYESNHQLSSVVPDWR
jgi:hypothetical protein